VCDKDVSIRRGKLRANGEGVRPRGRRRDTMVKCHEKPKVSQTASNPVADALKVASQTAKSKRRSPHSHKLDARLQNQSDSGLHQLQRKIHKAYGYLVGNRYFDHLSSGNIFPCRRSNHKQHLRRWLLSYSSLDSGTVIGLKCDSLLVFRQIFKFPIQNCYRQKDRA